MVHATSTVENLLRGCVWLATFLAVEALGAQEAIRDCNLNGIPDEEDLAGRFGFRAGLSLLVPGLPSRLQVADLDGDGLCTGSGVGRPRLHPIRTAARTRPTTRRTASSRMTCGALPARTSCVGDDRTSSYSERRSLEV